MNPTIFMPNYEQIVGKTELFNTGITSSLGER